MDKYAVIGHPIAQSLSPKIHLAFAQQTKINIEYSAIEAPLDGFTRTLRSFQKYGGKGCNITAPFKLDAFKLATTLGAHAKIAKAVNCIRFLDDNNLFADNFDGIGLVNDLCKNKKFLLTHKNILIIGAGGATQGILGPLLEKAPHSILIANRTGDKALHLAQTFRALGPVTGIALNKLTAGHFDLIIHASTLGHQQEDILLPAGLIEPQTLCYDLSYGLAAHTFLHWAKKNGALLYCDGLGMLVEQAAASFHLWHGVYPETTCVFNLLQTA